MSETTRVAAAQRSASCPPTQAQFTTIQEIRDLTLQNVQDKLPTELVDLIREKLIQAWGLRKVKAKVVKLDLVKSVPFYETETLLVDFVDESGTGILKCENSQKHPRLYTNFIEETVPSVAFHVSSPQKLERLSPRLVPFINQCPNSAITIIAAVFHGDPKWKELEGWNFNGHLVHGSRQNAYEHFGEWTRASAGLPPKVQIILDFQYPWRYYQGIRYLVSPLLIAGRQLQVVVRKEKWQYIPDPEFHIALTAASVQGPVLPRQWVLSRDERRMLADNGCIGISAWALIHWGPDKDMRKKEQDDKMKLKHYSHLI